MIKAGRNEVRRGVIGAAVVTLFFLLLAGFTITRYSAGGLESASTISDLSRVARIELAWWIGGATLLTIAITWSLVYAWIMAEAHRQNALDELRSREDRLERVVQITSAGVWEFDLASGAYTHLSEQALEILGHPSTASPLTGEALLAMVHPDDLPSVCNAFDAHVSSGRHYDNTFRIRIGADRWRWIHIQGDSVRDATGLPLSMVGVMTDITVAKEAEANLARDQTLIRTVLDAIPDPVLVKDRNYRLLMVNQAYAERTGLPVEEIVGKCTHELLPKEEADELVTADAAVFETGRDQVFELRITNRGKKMVRTHLVTKRLAHDTDGQPIMVGLHTDVTDLRRVIAQFSAVIQDTPLVAVMGVDRNGVVTHWNRASEVLFGYKEVRASGSRLQDLLLNSRLQHHFEVLLEDIWTRKVVYGPREIRMVLPDGRALWLLLTFFPVIQDERVIEVFGMAVDVTTRRKAQRQLAQHRDNLQVMVAERTAGLVRVTEELRAALKSRSEFLANMSHELRTPMHAILSFAQLGHDRIERGSTEKLRDYFQRISTSGERLLLLINDLLDLSKLESGKMLINPVNIDVAEQVRGALFELESLIEMKKLRVRAPEPKETFFAEIDPQRFSQVLHNLLSNAIKFSPEAGEIRIKLGETKMPRGRRATDVGERPALWLIVEDDGPGIPATELDDIFDKFVQSSKTRSGAGGTGLGLAICREIVNAHQGRISARNTPNGGAAFDVLFPLQYSAAAAGSKDMEAATTET